MNIKRFWVEDEFVDKYFNKLSLKAQSVYIILCRHANRNGFTTIGKKRISNLSGTSISSVKRALRELKEGSLVTPYQQEGGSNMNRWGFTVIPLGGRHRPHKELGIIKGIHFKKTREEIERDKEALKNVKKSLKGKI